MTTTPRSPAPCSKKSTRGISSSVLIGSPYHKKSNAEAQRFDGVRGDTLQAFANRRKDDWDTWLPYAIFAIKNAAPRLGGELTPFFINPGQRLRGCACRCPSPLNGPGVLPGETAWPLCLGPASMIRSCRCLPRLAGRQRTTGGLRDSDKALKQVVRAKRHVAHQEPLNAALDPGRVDTTFLVGGQVMLLTEVLRRPLARTRIPYTLPHHCKSHNQRRPTQALPLSRGPAHSTRPEHRSGSGGVAGGGAASPQQDPPLQDLLFGPLAGPRLRRRLVGTRGPPRALPGAARGLRGSRCTAP